MSEQGNTVVVNEENDGVREVVPVQFFGNDRTQNSAVTDFGPNVSKVDPAPEVVVHPSLMETPLDPNYVQEGVIPENSETEEPAIVLVADPDPGTGTAPLSADVTPPPAPLPPGTVPVNQTANEMAQELNTDPS